MNLAASLARNAADNPDRVAIRLDDDSILTYRDLADASGRVATMLCERGVRPGDRVAVMLPNVPHFAAVYYGILRAGGVVVPMNPLLKAARGRLLPRRLRRGADRRLARLRGRGRRRARSVPVRRSWSSARTSPRCSPRWRRRPAPPRGPAPTPRSSSTRPVPPGSPRARSCRTGTCR